MRLIQVKREKKENEEKRKKENEEKRKKENEEKRKKRTKKEERKERRERKTRSDFNSYRLISSFQELVVYQKYRHFTSDGNDRKRKKKEI